MLRHWVSLACPPDEIILAGPFDDSPSARQWLDAIWPFFYRRDNSEFLTVTYSDSARIRANITGYYLCHRCYERTGGKETLLAGPYIDGLSAAADQEEFKSLARRQGLAENEGYFVLTVKHTLPASLPRGLFTPASLFAKPRKGLM